MHYVYCLKDPNTQATRWVGITADPAQRLRQHVSEAKLGIGTNLHKDAWIASFLPQRPLLVILHTVPTEAEALALEKQVMRHCWDTEVCLLNRSTVGGNTGVPCTPEKRAKISVSCRKAWTLEMREAASKRSSARTPYVRTVENRRKISQSNRLTKAAAPENNRGGRPRLA